MRWQGRRGSENVIDKTTGGAGVSSGSRASSKRGKAVGGGSLVLTLLLAGLMFAAGVSPDEIVSLLDNGEISAAAVTVSTPVQEGSQSEAKQFMSVVLADTEEVWSDLFQEEGEEYIKPHLVLFEDKVDSACGLAEAAIGPFYCPADENLYLDLSFFQELEEDLGAPGDFAQAYVIGHEVGHHIQNLRGVLADVEAKQRRKSKKKKNDLDVRVELQADYYAGVWAHHAQKRFNILEEGDIEEALRAASAIGDDTLQKAEQGYAVPDTFQHGSSAQRVRWFKLGFKRGDFEGGDTFSAKKL